MFFTLFKIIHSIIYPNNFLILFLAYMCRQRTRNKQIQRVAKSLYILNRSPNVNQRTLKLVYWWTLG